MIEQLRPSLFCFLLLTFVSGFFTPVSLNAQNSSPNDSIAEDKIPDDPTELITRMELKNEFYQTNTEGYLNLTTLRLVYRVAKRLSIRADLPVAYSAPGVEGVEPKFGLSDVSVRLLGWRIINRLPWVAVASAEMAFNTASDPLLGTGKNQIIPSFAIARFLPKQKVISAVVVQQFISFGGFSDRQNFNYSRLTFVELRAFKGGWIFVAQPKLFYDWENGTHFSMVLEAIGVKMMSRNYSLAMQAGAGLFGDLPTRYDWKLEVDLRKTFR